ncbi:MAG TPA: nucleotidyltransferase family protein [Geminicoccaceae bacterium]|nr:nucleotidyltransferase family protein [Geminicoccaceae bacterium]
MNVTAPAELGLGEILDRLRHALPELRQRYPVGSIAVFGSRARGTAGPESDLDLLVEWSGPASLLDYAGLRAELEERTGLKVELTNRRLLKPALAPEILREAVAV